MGQVAQYGERSKRRADYGHKAGAPAGVYQRPLPRREPAYPAGRGQARVAAPREVGPFFVQGKRASDLEWRVYKALKRLGWSDSNVDFQTPILGGRLPGGAVLDFVVWTMGGPVIVEPNGDYWHTSAAQLIQRDKQRSQMIAEVWHHPFRYYILAQGDLLDDDMAYRKLLILVGRGF